MAFVKKHQPCHDCGSSDAAAINDDGSAYCFSCNKFFKDYNSTSEVQQLDTVTDFEVYQRNSKMSDIPTPLSSSAAFVELTDRKISLATAKKYGVKASMVGSKIDKHYYPYFNGHELAATKIRKANKDFAWTGSSKEVG